MREEEKEFQEEMLSIDRVTRVTAGWRQIRFRASVVIGDGKGSYWSWYRKAWRSTSSAIEKAIRDAKKNLITFPIVNGTIPHDVAVNFKASALYIHPAHPGTGIIAWGAVRKIFAVSGIKDIIAKQHGAPNDIRMLELHLRLLRLSNLRAWISIFHQKSHPLRLPK
jgi:small subunit ribosomal protein S5